MKISEFTVVENRKRKVFEILEHLPYLSPFLGLVARPRSLFTPCMSSLRLLRLVEDIWCCCFMSICVWLLVKAWTRWNWTLSPLKIVSMIRKYHNHKMQTNPWHHEEEPHNNQELPWRQTKESNQPSPPPPPHQDDCKTRRDIKKRKTKHRSHNGRNNKQQQNHWACSCRDNSGSENYERKYLIQQKLTRNDVFSARS